MTRPLLALQRTPARVLALVAWCLVMMASSFSHARELTGATVAVRTPAGRTEGRRSDGVDAFVGIPYAAAPVADLRWRPPQPAPRWRGSFSATAFGNDCPQVRIPGDATPSDQPMSENCLTLNVWRPQPARARSSLPVMVYIHGGGFVAGSSASPVLDGAALARRGVVLVSFNYRLGRFGFFAHPALTREAGGRASANFAFLDMIAALRWVQDNAAAFGGDPHNVTIFGESAGGAAVMFLMTSPAAQGLFHRAIIQSGAGRQPYARLDTDRPSRVSAYMAGFGFASRAGLTAPDAAALRALPAETVQGGLALWDMQSERFTGPVIDGETVVDDPDRLFAEGAVASVPLIVGSNGAELSEEVFAPVMVDLIRAQQSRLSMAALEAVYGDPPDLAIVDDYFFGEAARGFARMRTAHGAPAWLYLFDHVAEAQTQNRRGAAHASDLAFVFGNLPGGASAGDREMTRLLGDYWVRFAQTGDPNRESLPVWPRHRAGDATLVFAAANVSVQRNRNAHRLDAIERAMAERPR